MVATLGAAFAACAIAAPLLSSARLVQLGPKLSGRGERGAQFGSSVALSGDGATALVGAPDAHAQNGSAFIYVRSGSTWKQQGPTITGSTLSSLGSSVALSADGNTALVDEPVGAGHVWVYTRSGATWKREAELVGKGEPDDSEFGQGLALSEDGNTALVGDPLAHGDAGAVWLFTRSGSRWAQGAEFGGSEKNGFFGQSVALSADGTTALVGWSGFHNFAGAAEMYTRSGSAWKAGPLLTADGKTAGDGFGSQVALSADGDSAFIVGGEVVNPSKLWVVTHSGSAWTQTQLKTEGRSFFDSLALSADGTTALVGARTAHGGTGTVFVYSRSAAGWSLYPVALSVQGDTGEGFGNSVSVSRNGRVALIGGSGDSDNAGAAWLFAAPG
jgi:hypothetical protein